MKIYFLIFCSILAIQSCSSQQKDKDVYAIAFYNVENLFDTHHNPAIDDGDFTPTGKYGWTEDRYRNKLRNLSHVISLLGKDETDKGLAILGVAEVENKKVMEDLLATEALAKRNYRIVHRDSPDARGIDVGLIYDPQIFSVSFHKVYPFTTAKGKGSRTRDILVVSGTLAGEPLCVLVNHWPSRRGNDSEALRKQAASICKHIGDSIFRSDPRVGIIIMGDMNDDPQDISTSLVLGAKREMKDVKAGELYNPMWNILESGIGTSRYRDTWNLFDQIIISESLLLKGQNKLNIKKASVFNEEFLFQQSGKYKGHPLRTLSGNTYLNGYSDHLPSVLYLTKEN